MELTLESVFRDSQPLCDAVVADERPWPRIGTFCLQALLCSGMYGFSMGLRHSFLQAFVAAAKVPLLFLLTLLICLPTLHFVGLLFGSRARLIHTVEILLAGIAATGILLGAFAPIALFFLVTGSRYEFLLLFHVAIFAFCGAAGLRLVHRNFRYIRARTSAADSADTSLSVLRVWMAVYMFVGTQMAYALSPFIGRETTFMWFHNAGGNFYTYVLRTLFEALR